MSLCLLTLSPKPPLVSTRRISWPWPQIQPGPGRSGLTRPVLHCGQDSMVRVAPRPCWMLLWGPLFSLGTPRPDPNPSHSFLYAKGPQIYLQPHCFPKPKTDARDCALTISPGAQGATRAPHSLCPNLLRAEPGPPGQTTATCGPEVLAHVTGTGTAQHQARGGSGWLVSNLRPTQVLCPQEQSGQNRSDLLGVRWSPGQGQKLCSGPTAPGTSSRYQQTHMEMKRMLPPHPWGPVWAGERVNDGVWGWLGQMPGSSIQLSQPGSLPPRGDQGISCTFPYGTNRPSQCPDGSTCRPERTGKGRCTVKTPHQGASTAHSAFGHFVRINVPQPWATKGTRLHHPDITDREIQAATCNMTHRKMGVLTVFSRTRHAWLLGDAGEHWAEGEKEQSVTQCLLWKVQRESG